MTNFVHRQWFPALIAILITGPVAIAALDNDVPVKLIDVHAREKEVARGGPLVLEVTLQRDRLCPGEVFRAFIDSKETLFPINSYRFLARFGVSGNARELGKSTVPITIDVPYAAAPGPAKYQSSILYTCNWLQRALGYGPVLEYPVQEIIVKDEVVGMNDRPRAPGILPSQPVNAIRRLIPTFLEKQREPAE